jgi:hypothetical protein
MFHRATCLPMRIACGPHVEFAALPVLRELLADVAGEHGRCLPLNTPVSGAAGEARDQNRGNAHATQPPASSYFPIDASDLPIGSRRALA